MSYDDWKCATPSEYEAREPGCLCHWEAGDSRCPVHGEEPDCLAPDVCGCSGCEYRRALGPCFPAAHCASHPDTRLTFERHDYFPEWNCWCKDCVDGDYDSERGQYVATYPIGSGATLDEALDDYAIRCDVETDTLQVKEGS